MTDTWKPERSPSGDAAIAEAKTLAATVAAMFTTTGQRIQQMAADSLTVDPERLDWIAAEHGLPRPTDAVKLTAIAILRAGEADDTPPPIIPPADQRPVCVLVGWLAEHPSFLNRLEYLDGLDRGPRWLPASTAVKTIDPEWPVEVREVKR